MRHDIEGDWLLFRTCNYRCDYCFLPASVLGEKVQIHATPAEWRAAFDRTGKTWLLHMTGGEPSHYPDFIELAATLTERHFMSLNSNLTGPAIERFAERIDPARVSFVNAGLHPAERERRKGLGVFLRHAEKLRARGFPIMVTVVATPAVLRNFEAIIDALRPIGLRPIPKMLQGKHGNGRYPESYTEEERDLFRRYSEAAEGSYPHLFGGGRERPSIDPTLGRGHLAKTPDYLGRMCSAGQEFVMIGPRGNVFRCGGGATMGNLLAGSVRFESKAAPCDRAHCFYFCEKFTSRAAAREAERPTPFAAIAARIKRSLTGAPAGR